MTPELTVAAIAVLVIADFIRHKLGRRCLYSYLLVSGLSGIVLQVIFRSTWELPWTAKLSIAIVTALYVSAAIFAAEWLNTLGDTK